MCGSDIRTVNWAFATQLFNSCPLGCPLSTSQAGTQLKVQSWLGLGHSQGVCGWQTVLSSSSFKLVHSVTKSMNLSLWRKIIKKYTTLRNVRKKSLLIWPCSNAYIKSSKCFKVPHCRCQSISSFFYGVHKAFIVSSLLSSPCPLPLHPVFSLVG